jgi:Tfp pilus assembly protein PilN
MKAVNLIPGEHRQGSGSFTGRSGGAALIVLGMLAALAAIVAMYGSAHRAISKQTGEVAALAAQTSAVEARTGRLTPYTNFVSMASQRTQTVAQLIQTRFDWSHSLHELGRVLPPGTSLTSLHAAVGAAGKSSGSSSSATAGAAASGTPASSTPPGSTPAFTLTGCATSQSVVAQTLQRLRLMDGAGEVQLQSSTKTGTSGAGSSGGTCPPGDPAFSVQITFDGLPSTPAPSVSTSPTAASAQGGGSTEPVSTQGKAAPR